MRLSAIFAKPVNRNIEGVIKADDEASLKTEVEEFVVTREVERRLSDFLEAYNDYQGANGAWISGFFGSGKSHLLKMLALLLENRPIDGHRSLDLFLPKCKDNEILAAEIRRAVAIPSREHPLQHRPEGRPDQQGAGRRAALRVRAGLRRDVRLLRQAGSYCPVRA